MACGAATRRGDEYFRGNKEEAEARAAWFRAEHGAKKDRPRYSVERMPVGTAVKAASPITADAARVSLAFESVVEALREALSLATALHARDHRADIAECAQDRRQAETLSQAERRVHAVMWERESPAVRERYAAEAVGLLAWIKGAK